MADNFVIDPFYENIRAPMWVNFSNPDEVEGDSWFDTLSDTDDADRVRLMPTEFEIAQLLPDQEFDSRTPEKPRSPTVLRTTSVAEIPAPVFSDDEDTPEEQNEDVMDETAVDKQGAKAPVLPATPDQPADSEGSFEDVVMEEAQNDDVTQEASTPQEAPTEADEDCTMEDAVVPETPTEPTSSPVSDILLPASPQMPTESAEPRPALMGDASNEATVAPTAEPMEEEAVVEGEAAAETPVVEEAVEPTKEPEATATTEAAVEDPVIEDTEEPTTDSLATGETTEEVQEQMAAPLESVAAPCVATANVASAPEEPVVEEPQDEASEATPSDETSQDVSIELVKPADITGISTPTSEDVVMEDASMEDASTSTDSGLDLSAVVEEGEDEDDFLMQDGDDSALAAIDNKEAIMMEEIEERRRALEEKKAQAAIMEVKVMGPSSTAHAGLRTPTLQEAFQKHRKKASKAKPAEPTEPEEFSFSTQSRAERRSSARRQSYSSASDSEASLHRAWTGQVTEPKEFHFRTEERVQLRRSMRPSEISDAMKEPVTPSHREWTGELTEPREFNFSTDERMQLRSMNKAPIISSDERELQECRHFKAYPLNRKVLESAGDLGVPRLAKRKLTRPQSPALATRDRSILRKRTRGEVDEEEPAEVSGFDSGTDCQFDFAARFGREQDQANKIRRLSLTEPKPFSFQTEQRAALRKSIRPTRSGDVTPGTCYSSDCESSMSNSVQRRASAKRSRRRKRAAQQAQPLGLTEPKPFSFATDERAALRTPTKKRKLAESAEDTYEEAEAARKAYSTFDRFAAEPRGRAEVPAKKQARRRSRSLQPRQLTEPQPFRFQTEQRALQASISKPTDTGLENGTNLFAPLSSVNKAPRAAKKKQTQPKEGTGRALGKVSAAKLNTNGRRTSPRLMTKKSSKEHTSRLMKPTAASQASSTAASKAIQKKPRSHAMKTRASRRKLTEPHSPMLHTRLRAAAIHGMRDL